MSGHHGGRDECERLQSEALRTGSLAQSQQKAADADRLRPNRIRSERSMPQPFFRN